MGSKTKRMLSDEPNGNCAAKQRRMDAFVQRSSIVAFREPLKTPTNSELFEYLQDPDWRRVLAPEFSKDYFKKIEVFLTQQWSNNKVIYPEKKNIFAALNTTSIKQVKVVIIGQDPYHGHNQATGYSFSVPLGVPPPPSLRNIFKELSNDIEGFTDPGHGCLVSWAKEGVLLLNASLTVERHQPNSHSNIGWQIFTDHIIKCINDHCFGVIFLLWGSFAQKKEALVNKEKHTVIKTAHPSPYSVTRFFGCKCFSKANAALQSYGRDGVKWLIPN